MKHNALGFDFPVFDVHFVATKDDGNVLTDTDQVTMPVGHVLIGDSRGDVKHDDSTLSCGGKGDVLTLFYVGGFQFKYILSRKTVQDCEKHLECNSRLSGLQTSPDQLCPTHCT